MAPSPNLGASMSSTLVVPPGDSTQSPLPQSTPSSNDNNSSLQQKGANYFFGFLISFVVLLLVFVACGITSRRRFLARRGPTILGAVQPWGSSGDMRIPQTVPVFYECFTGEPALAEDGWRYTMVPLQCAYVCFTANTYKFLAVVQILAFVGFPCER
ncbi:hypothetical protein CPB84DRAFT_1783419 [Gymnopilus junonius]|uniref:Uncharacterized protein n=1 Tax=Gymnopilus junonius TaxID=109634 RepID=A0A9P5TKM6_GYMJU|nr:hypothetical protein CPB84DRAFT_1783419 [Gymnopilus junonius]